MSKRILSHDKIWILAVQRRRFKVMLIDSYCWWEIINGPEKEALIHLNLFKLLFPLFAGGMFPEDNKTEGKARQRHPTTGANYWRPQDEDRWAGAAPPSAGQGQYDTHHHHHRPGVWRWRGPPEGCMWCSPADGGCSHSGLPGGQVCADLPHGRQL